MFVTYNLVQFHPVNEKRYQNKSLFSGFGIVLPHHQIPISDYRSLILVNTLYRYSTSQYQHHTLVTVSTVDSSVCLIADNS